jgi:MoaA/NifB/PqqE/SkfB family radical SAM enzyme
VKLAPHYIFVQYTTLCNSRCTTCHNWNLPPQTLSADDAGRIGRFVDPERLREIYFTGGEPFLPTNCVEVALALHQWCPAAVFTSATNGLAPDLYLPRIRAIRDAGVDLRVIVSLNGRPETHNLTRGTPNGYTKCREMIDGLVDIGAFVTVNILHIPGVTTPADIEHAGHVASLYGKPLFHSLWTRRMEWFGQKDDGATIPPFDCHAGDIICVRPNGDITACQEPRPRLIFGNLRDVQLDDAKVTRVMDDIHSRACQPCGCCTTAFTHGRRCLT